MTEEFTAGSAIKAFQEASEKINVEDYLRLKADFILLAIGTTEERQ